MTVLLAIAAVAAVVAVVAGLPRGGSEPAERAGPVDATAQQDLDAGSGVAEVTAAIVQPKPTPRPDGEVAAPAKDQAYPLAEWAIVDVPGGHLDVARPDGGRGDGLSGRQLKSGDAVEFSGWAGITDIGVRLPHIVLSACGKVFASADVNGLRPDVALAAHPNLSQSGWTARVLVDHIPRCADGAVRAWGVSRLGPALLPLHNSVTLDLPEAAGVGARAQPPLRPEAIVEGDLLDLHITASMVNVRRCGGTDCEVISQLPAGSYPVYLLQEDVEWSLISFESGAGWLANDLFTITGR